MLAGYVLMFLIVLVCIFMSIFLLTGWFRELSFEECVEAYPHLIFHKSNPTAEKDQQLSTNPLLHNVRRRELPSAPGEWRGTRGEEVVWVPGGHHGGQ